MATYISEGKRIDYTPGSAVAAGDVIVMDNLIGIATSPIAANTVGSLAVEGIFDVPKKQEAFNTLGAPVYWDADGDPYGGTAGSGAATATSTAGPLMGFVVETAGATDTTVRVLLASEVTQDFGTTLSLSAADDEDGTGTVTIQVQDAAGNDLAGRFLVHCWTDDTDFGAPTALTGFAPTTGTTISAYTANADLAVLTDANGRIVLDCNKGSAGTIYVMAELGGRASSVELAITSS